MDTQKYNGWTNYATWMVNLHFDCFTFTSDVESGVFDDMDADDIRCHVASRIQGFVESHVEEYDIPYGRGGFVIDLINATLNDVDWHDIADHYVDDILDAVNDRYFLVAA